jgi:ubiquinone/menaquinone biosynthesis C-methylase UbiE
MAAIGLDKQQIFNLWAPAYDSLWTTVFYQAVHQRLLEYVELPDRANILDIGCGTGKLLDRLATEYPKLRGTGLDFSDRMLEQARQRNRYGDRLSFVRGEVSALPFEDKQFDAAFCTISFLHYPDPEAVLAEVERVLRRRGRFYLADYTLPRCLTGSRKLPISPDGITLYSQEARSQLGTSAGLHCAGHYYLLGLVMLTVFVKDTQQ